MIVLYYGPVVNPKSLAHYDALPRCLIAVASDGNIIWVEDDIDANTIHNTIDLHGLQQGEFHLVDFTARPGDFIMPGMVDTHVHACQFPIMGVGGDDALLDWLLNTVFPTEAKFESTEYAKSAYSDVIDRSIASGTTTSCYYGSLHLEATKILADIVRDKGQRGFIGKCSMDWNCPGYYIEKTPEASMADTIKLIQHIQSFPLSHGNETLVHPIITPRFALSCSDKLLTDLGKLAALHPKIPIQTHISENRREIEETVRRFGTKSYAEVYERFGLLRNNTILGHGVWLTEKEMKLIAKRGAAVAHCPASNFYLGSGMARVGMLLDHGVKVGLGTDVSGGCSPSILYTIQMASTASKMVAVQAELDEEQRHAHKHCRHGKHSKGKHGKCCKDSSSTSDSSSDLSSESDSGSESEKEKEKVTAHQPKPIHRHYEAREHDHPHPHHHHTKNRFTNKKLQTPTLLYLATLGGADVCNLASRVGSFAPGKAFDAIYVSLDNRSSNPAVWGQGVDEAEMKPNEGNMKRWVERFLFGGDNRNVRQVWVQGVVVGGVDRQTNAQEQGDT